MAVEIMNASQRSNLVLGDMQVKTGMGSPVVVTATVEVPASASVNSTFTFFRVPLDARIHGASRVHHDDLASTGSPTIDIGLRAVKSNFTTDVDALNDGIDVFTAAAANVPVVKDIANFGKKVREFTDAGTNTGFADVIVTILDAAANTGGTITMELVYSVD